jgi:hypothetical protein
MFSINLNNVTSSARDVLAASDSSTTVDDIIVNGPPPAADNNNMIRTVLPTEGANNRTTNITAIATATIVDDTELIKRTSYAQTVARIVATEHPWFADLDLSTGYAQACGIRKCFYASKTNQSVGYLVASKSEYKQMKAAYQLETTLSQDFGTVRLGIGPPFKAKIANYDVLSILKQYTRQWGYKEQEQILSSDEKLTIVAVQRVWKAPEPSLTVAFTPRKGGSMLQKFPWFVEQISDPKQFYRRFRTEQRRTIQVLSKYSQLLDDFQVMIDSRGNFYHIDLDRNGGGDSEEIDDPKELAEELDFIYNDLEWLLYQLMKSTVTFDPTSEIPKCQHSFCKKYTKQQKQQLKQQQQMK